MKNKTKLVFIGIILAVTRIPRARDFPLGQRK